MNKDPMQSVLEDIAGIAKGHSEKATLGAHSVLGTITDTGLSLPSVGFEVRDYLLARGLVVEAGDKVLVCPVNDGNDFVVVCVVV